MLLNKKRMIEVMERENIDALIASSPANVVYSSEFWCTYHWMQLANVFVILPRDDTLEETLVIPTSIADIYCAENLPIADVRCFGPGPGEPQEDDKKISNLLDWQMKLYFMRKYAKTNQTGVELLAEVIKDKGLGNKQLGFDEKGISNKDMQRILKLLPQAKNVEANNLFREIRMIKTKEEVARLRRASEISEKAIAKTLESAHKGITEKELLEILKVETTRNGAMAFMNCVSCGQRTSMGNVEPSFSKYSLKKGDLIRFDVGCVWRNYCSDVARTATLGIPSKKAKIYYNAILAGEEEMLNNIRAGVKVNFLFKIASHTIRKSGIPRYLKGMHGHGIGVFPDYYDPPLINATNETQLEEGMVINIETFHNELGFGSVMVEDTVLVTNSGYELLTRSDRELLSI